MGGEGWMGARDWIQTSHVTALVFTDIQAARKAKQTHTHTYTHTQHIHKWWLQNFRGNTSFLRNTKEYNYFRYISFKTIALCIYTLLPDTVKMWSNCSLLRNPWPKAAGELEHCREGKINCWFSIFRGVSFWPHP